ncbi:hypothetical protein MRX96_056372 [Rhipicephalus microplus]
MSLSRPSSAVHCLDRCDDQSYGRACQDTGATTKEIARQELAKPHLTYMYNNYDSDHRQSFVAKRKSSGRRASPSRYTVARHKGQLSNETVPSLTPPASLGGSILPTQNSRPLRGLLMLVQPKFGQSIESFTVDGFLRAACDVVSSGMISSRLTARGGLLVEVSSANVARRLLKTRTLCGLAVDVQVPRSDQQNVGLIRDVTKWYTDEEVADQLSSQGVVQARRVKTRPREGLKGAFVSSEDNAQPTDKVVLVFMPHEKRPRYVTLDAVDHEVEEYRPEVPQCYECHRVGHVARHCPFNLRCARCGGPHPAMHCDMQRMRCANCGQGHRATYRFCPARQRWRGLRSANATGNAKSVLPNLQSVILLPDKKIEADTPTEWNTGS